jgi:hypothetical protein
MTNEAWATIIFSNYPAKFWRVLRHNFVTLFEDTKEPLGRFNTSILEEILALHMAGIDDAISRLYIFNGSGLNNSDTPILLINLLLF